MLDGWYCRNKPEETPEATNGQTVADYRTKFRELKKKLKYLVHENEFFKEAVKAQQTKLLKVTRERSLLLDRLSRYEKPEDLSDGDDSPDDQPRKRKQQDSAPTSANNTPGGGPNIKPGPKRRRSSKAKPLQTPAVMTEHIPQPLMFPLHNPHGTMTAEEMERHLALREFQTLDMTADVPNEMFSSESNDNDTPPNSHSNIEEECVSMDNMIIHHEINLPYSQD